jgi:large subunit ribosomal protein L29
MKVIELKEQTREELEMKLLETKKSLFNLKFQKSTGQLENPLKIRNLRKDIARIKTVLREKELKIRTEQKSKKESKKK